MVGEPLFDYQDEGGQFLASRKLALLADEMGLGKSAQAIIAADAVKAERILVLCPGARINWIREFEKWSTTARKFRAVMTSKQVVGAHESAVCSYNLMGRGAHIEVFDDQWDALILDESHRLKDPAANWTRAVVGENGVIHRATRTWFLTGTPAPNHAGELWLVLYLSGVTRLDKEAFEHRYCTGYDNGFRWQITGTNEKRIPELQAMLAKIMLRRTKKDVNMQLPPIHYTQVTVEPGEVDLEICFPEHYMPHNREDELLKKVAEERQLVENCVKASEKSVAPDKTLVRMLDSIYDCTATVRRYDGLRKVDPVVETVARELENGDYQKVVLFAVHKWVIEGLRRGLSKYRPVTLYGGTHPTKRQRNVDKFQDPESKCRVFIGNLHAAGTQITLTAAHQVGLVEYVSTPGDNAQAIMRCHRIGQDLPVSVRFFALNNSTDEKTTRAYRRKARELTKLFDDE